MRTRDNLIAIRCSDVERLAFAYMARREGRSVSDWLRRLGIQAAIRAGVMPVSRGLIDELRRDAQELENVLMENQARSTQKDRS